MLAFCSLYFPSVLCVSYFCMAYGRLVRSGCVGCVCLALVWPGVPGGELFGWWWRSGLDGCGLWTVHVLQVMQALPSHRPLHQLYTLTFWSAIAQYG